MADSKKLPVAVESAHNWSVISIPSQSNLPVIPVNELRIRGEAAIRGKRTAAQWMVSVLCDLGLTTFFGVPGGPIIPFFDAVLTEKRARLVEPRHEAYGAFAAMGYQRASGRVPVVAVTAGPGATNVVTGVVAAHFERVPMVVVCGDVPWSATGHRMLQDTGIGGVGIERMLQGVTRAVLRISHAASAAGQVRAAVQAATGPNPGPVLVVLAIDRAGSQASSPHLFAPLPPPPAAAPPEPELVLLAAQILLSAFRPLVLVGAGCRRDAVRVQTLVETLGAPFATTPQGKGVLPEDHPLCLRTTGMGSSLWARRYLREGVDATLVLGTDLDDISTLATPPIGRGGVLIHVDTDASVFARNIPTAIAALCDLGAFADALTDTVRRLGVPEYRMELVTEVQARPAFDTADFASDEQVPLAPHRAVADLERAAWPGTTFVTDIGEHMIYALHYLTISPPQRFAIHLGLGSMASGICSSIGQALGEPDPGRRVICICGDGGMQMAGMELLVARKHRLPIVYAVFNDARYNMVYHGYRLTFGREAAWETPMVDFVKWAESLGLRGQRIERPGEITRALLDRLTADGGPAVLDIRYNADIRVRGSGRLESIRDMTKLHDPRKVP